MTLIYFLSISQIVDTPGIRRSWAHSLRGCRSEENYKQSERDGERRRGKRRSEKKRRGTGAKPEREREREREKPDSAPPYATTCIDRGLCHWIPPVVGRFLSLLLSYFLHTMSRSDSQPTNLIERCSVIETSKIKFAI